MVASTIVANDALLRKAPVFCAGLRTQIVETQSFKIVYSSGCCSSMVMIYLVAESTTNAQCLVRNPTYIDVCSTV